ncbi:hypothetical protein HDU85_006009 [Gaertneriomyces sp. JEL0708]|nr:hypothetical protein HDU85_006009 [Gaertneriomyces sp. JEL0708]
MAGSSRIRQSFVPFALGFLLSFLLSLSLHRMNAQERVQCLAATDLMSTRINEMEVKIVELRAANEKAMQLQAVQVVEPKTVPSTLRHHLKGQAGQDRWMFEHVFYDMYKKGQKGVFVEFGARDGKEHSNTYFYEHALGWKGLLVEAVEWEFKDIAKNRPNSLAIHGAVCDKNGTAEFMVAKAGGLHGIVEDYADHRKNWEDHLIKVPCYTLNSLLDQAGMHHVNYMTVDTEGSEVTVLSALDWSSFVIDYVQVEMLIGTKQAEEKKVKLEELMKKVGYELVIEYVVAPKDTLDMIYRRTDQADLLKWDTARKDGFVQA